MRTYLIYLCVLMVSLFGTNLTDFALGIWILDQPDGSVSSYSMVWFFQAFPGVLLAPFIGGLIDRWNKKKMIVTGLLVAGLASALMMLLHYFAVLRSWHIMSAAAVGSIAGIFVFRSFSVSIPAMVPKENLVRASGLSITLYSIIEISVPILAPVLYKLVGITYIFSLDVVTFVISVLFFMASRFVAVTKISEGFDIGKDWEMITRFIKDNKGILHLTAFSFISNYLLGLTFVLFTPLLLDFSNEYVLGMILSVAGTGSLLGGVLMSRVRGKIKKPMTAILLTGFLKGMILIGFLVYLDPYALAVGGLLMFLLFTIEEVISESFYHTIIPIGQLGRVSGWFSFFEGFSKPMSFLCAGFFMSLLSGFKDSWFDETLGYLPGTMITKHIVLIFGLSGTLLLFVTLIFKSNRSLKALNDVYDGEFS